MSAAGEAAGIHGSNCSSSMSTAMEVPGSSSGMRASSSSPAVASTSFASSSSRRRSSTTSSSSSASTTRTTMTIVRSSRLAIDTSAVPITSGGCQPMLTSPFSSATLKAEFAHGPRRGSSGSSSPIVGDEQQQVRPSSINRHREQHGRSRSSSASYSCHVSSSASLNGAAMNRASSASGFEREKHGSAPDPDRRQTLARKSSSTNKGSQRTSLAGSGGSSSSTLKLAHTVHAPLRRTPSLTASTSPSLPPLTVPVPAVIDSCPTSPISPASPSVDSLAVSSVPIRPALPYRIPSFSKSEPVLDLSLSFQPAPSVGLLVAEQARLPLTPLEEVNSPLMTLDSPADLAESQDPFSSRALQEALLVAASAQRQDSDESFYHALLEIVQTEEGYTADLTDLVEVHFNLLTYARFVTEEQRKIIVRNAVQLLEIHHRLLAKLRRVDEDLGWVREQDDSARSSEDGHEPSPRGSIRLKSSDSTVFDAAKRICAIFLNESQNLEDAYKPFCSGHIETMEVTKILSSQKLDWDAFETNCTGLLATRKSASTRLHFADFLIKPVQRICRYPLLFANLLKSARKQEILLPLERMEMTAAAFKDVAAEVDEAQRIRNREIVTVKLALRLDVQNPHTANLLNHLEQAILVGSAHVIFTNTSPFVQVPNTPSSSVKANFYGLALYGTHLVMIKAKKTNLYEAKHWLPLRLFDMHKVPDGDGQLPYALKMSYRDYTFEIGSLCHQEQDIWADTIEQTTLECRKRWTDAVDSHPSNPAIMDDSLICSEVLDPALSWADATSPPMTSSEFGAPSPEGIMSSAIPASSLSSETESGHAPRPRLSLKPPAQRVATDLRLADLLSEAILTARAQSKRSHAMPLHGPPPRNLMQQNGSLAIRRPHSFASTSFSYRNIIDSTLSSRRSSISENDNTVRPVVKQIPSTGSGSSTSTYYDSAPDRRLPRPSRTRTSTSGSDIGPSKMTRSGTLSRIRRRAASLYQEQIPQKVIDDLRQQHQGQSQAQGQAPAAQIASQDDQPIVSADASGAANGTVARNSSTSSSSSCGSNSTNPSQISSSLDTPQSSLPASPLLTPVDLESSSRWTKFGDAVAHSLSRKRSFASARPLLAVQPEPMLQGVQLQRAQQAAEYIYTGNANAPAGNVSYGEHARQPSAGAERRISWDKFGWGRTGSSSSLSTQGYGHRSSYSAPNAGSQTSLHLSADRRQTSSGSLWSVFNREGASYTSSPTPSIYESTQEDEDVFPERSPGGVSSDSPQELTPTSSPPLQAVNASSAPSASPFAPGRPIRHASLSPPVSSTSSSGTGSKMKRSNSISARLRAFRTLGSSMTPLSNSGTSR